MDPTLTFLVSSTYNQMGQNITKISLKQLWANTVASCLEEQIKTLTENDDLFVETRRM
jgi:hypothetical protein